MAQKKKNWLSPERREPGGFAALPHCLLASQVYIGLSAHAVKLLIDLLAQFKGFNNGDLCLAWTIIEKRGWKSRDTLNKARHTTSTTKIISARRRRARRSRVDVKYSDCMEWHFDACTEMLSEESAMTTDIDERICEGLQTYRFRFFLGMGVVSIIEAWNLCYILRRIAGDE